MISVSRRPCSLTMIKKSRNVFCSGVIQQITGPDMMVSKHFNTYNAGLIGFTEHNYFYSLKFQKFNVYFDELINQNQACLYLFECISHGDSNYMVMTFQNVLTFVNFLWRVGPSRRLSHACRMFGVTALVPLKDLHLRLALSRVHRTVLH